MFLGLNYRVSRPEDMLLTVIPVPPVCIRPSVQRGFTGSNEDDLTIALGEICHTNTQIKISMAKGGLTSKVTETWDFLQQQVARYLNSDMPGFPKHLLTALKPLRALTQRLKGKPGRFRGNLSGKRVNFSGRTVISPDPNLRIDQVGVPRLVAMRLTYATL